MALNKSERRYTITNLGQLVLSLARQIEERSIIESGKMYVRTSNESIEEFSSHKISQSLSKEGGLPVDLAQKITEETENRIYKYQPEYLTGSLIRDIVNSVLLEHGHEEYRNKLARVGMPVYDVSEKITQVENIGHGVSSLLSGTGQTVFAEYLLASTLPKDMADYHLSGDVHITNPGTWSLLPDTIFLNIKELLDDGTNLGGKLLDVSRIESTKTLSDTITALSMMISLMSNEASQEVVFDGLQQVILKRTKNIEEIESRLVDAFTAASATSQHGAKSALISFRLHLGSDTKIVNAIISAYKKYVQMTPKPRIGLIISYESGKISDVSQNVAEIISLGGVVSLSQKNTSIGGVLNSSPKGSNSLFVMLGSISVNLPRLAFEANKDETYFRARMAMLIAPTFSAMSQRKKNVLDLTRRGLNPLLAQCSQYMQRGSVVSSLNLVGLREAVVNILGIDDKKSGEIMRKVIETAVDKAKKEGKMLGDDIRISMTENAGTTRFSALDGYKYGKNSALKDLNDKPYSEGIVLDAGSKDLDSTVTECAKISSLANGGLLIRLEIPQDADIESIKKNIEKIAPKVSSLRPIKQIPICGSCGYKGDKLIDKCPKCKSTYTL